MSPSDSEDVILRESRRTLLARRLLLHGVRTQFITRLTGLTDDRLRTLRKRLMISGKTRLRGHPRDALTLFLGTSLARAEAAAITALLWLFEIPIEPKAPSLPKRVSLPFGERLCDTYEAYCACYPRTKVTLEEVIELRKKLARGDRVRLGRCRDCKCLLLLDRNDASLECLHCSAILD
jgi:hypothetical protein